MQTLKVNFPYPNGRAVSQHLDKSIEDSLWYVIESPQVIVILETNENTGMAIVNAIGHYYKASIAEQPERRLKLWIIGNLNDYGEKEAAEYSLWCADQQPAFSFLPYEQALRVTGYALPKMRGNFQFD